MRMPQSPVTNNKPDKQKNIKEFGLKLSVFKYTIDPLNNKKHEKIIREMKNKLRFVIQLDSSLTLEKLSLSSLENYETPTTSLSIERWTCLNRYQTQIHIYQNQLNHF